MNDITRILNSIQQGDPKAAEELLPLVYEELRKLAAARMAREVPGQTLQATALVHEAWLRLTGNQEQKWDGRAHFFGAAAEAMRRILVERARGRQRLRHGGGQERVELSLLARTIVHADGAVAHSTFLLRGKPGRVDRQAAVLLEALQDLHALLAFRLQVLEQRGALRLGEAELRHAPLDPVLDERVDDFEALVLVRSVELGAECGIEPLAEGGGTGLVAMKRRGPSGRTRRRGPPACRADRRR
jgi:hypothetical protein